MPWSRTFTGPRQCCPSRRRRYRQGTASRVSKTEPSFAGLLSTSPNISWSIIAFATYLTDILVAHPADLLDISSGLGDTLEGVAGEDELILLGLGDLDIDTGLHNDAADDLLADEVAAQTL